MIIQTILIIALLVVAFLIAWKLFKSMVKAGFSILILVLIGLTIYGLLLYSDFTGLQEALQEEPTFILEKDNEYIANAIIKDFETGEVAYHTSEELEQAIEEGEKLFIILDYEYLTANQSVFIEGLDYNITPVLDQVFEAESFEEVAELVSDEEELFIIGLEESFEDVEEFKSYLLLDLLSSLQEESNLILELGDGVRKGKVSLEPSFSSIRVLDYLPLRGEE